MLKRLGNFETRDAFHSAKNSRSFRGNQMDLTILVWPGQNIKVVPYDWSCLLDWNVPFHFTNLLSPLLFFCILVTTWQYNNQMCGGFGWICKTRVYSFIGHIEFTKFQTVIFVEWKVPQIQSMIGNWCLSAVSWVGKRF